MSWMSFFKGIVHGAEAIEQNPITGVILSAINPEAGVWWQQTNAIITDLEKKNAGLSGQGPLMKAEAMATDPQLVKDINATLALTGKQWLGDPQLVGAAIDASIAAKKAIAAAAASFRIVDLPAGTAVVPAPQN